MRLVLAAIAFLALTAPANAAVITVNTNADLLDPLDGLCSLREAVINANANAAGGGCAGGEAAASDTIALAQVDPTLARAGANEDFAQTGDLDVRAGGPLVVEGHGGAISGAQIDRVFEVHVGASLTLRDVTIRSGLAPSGQPGGGVLNLGTLAVADSVLTVNRIETPAPGVDGGSGGGIFSTGTLTLSNTIVSDNDAGSAGPAPGAAGFAGGRGGGVYVTGAATITRSSFLRNSAGHAGDGDLDEDGGDGGNGGGLYVAPGGAGTTVTNSLFAGNTTGHGGDGGDASGGGSSGSGGNGGNGGAVATTVADVSIAFTTFIGNATSNGGVAGSGSPPGTQGAVGEGTDVAGGTQTTLARTIAAGTCIGAVVDGGQNLGSGGCPGSGAALNLGASHVPLAGSPAIDAASTNGCPATDLLGTARPQGVRCDIGALEARAGALTLSRSAFTFASLTAGLRSARLALTVRNPGPAAYALPISVTGGPDFRIAAETCPAELARGRSCAVTVAFAPSRAGGRTGTLRIAGRSIALRGTGLAPCVVPRLKGKTRKAARRALVRAHCTLGTVTRRGRGRPGRIRSSRPRAGSVLEAGAVVNVVVNRRRVRPRR
jgi:hypothetical protein